MSVVDRVEFNGIVFRRYPDGVGASERNYFVPDGRHRKQGVGRLHQEIWKDRHGPIPKGWHVHHRDGNPLNNDIDNLEALPGEEHVSRHGLDRGLTGEHLAHLERIRPLAAEWHRSEEGRAWHVEHGRAVFGDRDFVTGVCECCGASYETNTPWLARFCSNRCKSQWRRDSGIDDVTKQCECCGSDFRSNKYQKVRFCGTSCGVRHSRAKSCACFQLGD
jgi:hypothetical protein